MFGTYCLVIPRQLSVHFVFHHKVDVWVFRSVLNNTELVEGPLAGGGAVEFSFALSVLCPLGADATVAVRFQTKAALEQVSIPQRRTFVVWCSRKQNCSQSNNSWKVRLCTAQLVPTWLKWYNRKMLILALLKKVKCFNFVAHLFLPILPPNGDYHLTS